MKTDWFSSKSKRMRLVYTQLKSDNSKYDRFRGNLVGKQPIRPDHESEDVQNLIEYCKLAKIRVVFNQSKTVTYCDYSSKGYGVFVLPAE